MFEPDDGTDVVGFLHYRFLGSYGDTNVARLFTEKIGQIGYEKLLGDRKKETCWCSYIFFCDMMHLAHLWLKLSTVASHLQPCSAESQRIA